MSQQGPILVVATGGRPIFASALDEAKMFPVVDVDWADAPRAVEQLAPGAILASAHDMDGSSLAALAARIGARLPYLPLIVVDPETPLPDNAIPFARDDSHPERLVARVNAALRVRSLHATVMRRLAPGRRVAMSDVDPARDATVLLIGRGGAYPALSVALGERVGVVGALSIEAAAKHLSSRDINGIVMTEGFAPRVVEAFLTVLTEDVRFRNLPVVVTFGSVEIASDLANLEIVTGDPARVAASIMPMVRQNTFETYLSRTLRSLEADGLIDSRSGLLTPLAFDRDFETSVQHSLAHGGGLSVARFAFDPAHPRAQLDGARIISRLMRQSDFGVVREDGSVFVVFAETDLRNAHMISRRLSAVMRHTGHSKRDVRSEPMVSVETLLPKDTANALLARLTAEPHRAAS